MKRIAFLLILFLALFSCDKQNPKGISNELYSISKDEIDIHFTTKYRSEDLENIQLSLDSFGIYIIYDSLRFDDSGYLKQISASIYYSDNTKSSIVSRELSETDKPGFSYKHTPAQK